MKKYFVVILLLVTRNAFANSECAFRDFTAELGELRNQGQMSWCFAEAAADLITQKVHFRVSAAALLADFLAAPAPELWRRHESEIQTYLQLHPKLAHEIKVSRGQNQALVDRPLIETLGFRADKSNLDLSRGGITGESGLLTLGGDVDLAVLLADAGNLCTEDETPSDEKRVRQLLKQADQLAYDEEEKAQACLGVHASDPTSPLTDQGGYYVLQTYKKLLHENCKPKTVAALVPRHVGLGSVSELKKLSKNDEQKGRAMQAAVLEWLDYALDQRKAVAIDFSAYMVDRKADDDPDLDGDHAAVISGRQKVGDECYYQLRNSRGNDCNLVEPFKSRCRGGYTFVTAEELKRGLLNGIDFIE